MRKQWSTLPLGNGKLIWVDLNGMVILTGFHQLTPRMADELFSMDKKYFLDLAVQRTKDLIYSTDYFCGYQIQSQL